MLTTQYPIRYLSDLIGYAWQRGYDTCEQVDHDIEWNSISYFSN